MRAFWKSLCRILLWYRKVIFRRGIWRGRGPWLERFDPCRTCLNTHRWRRPSKKRWMDATSPCSRIRHADALSRPHYDDISSRDRGGRARDFEEAIAWHGGKGRTSRDFFL